jgi:hypothetical protein
MASFFLLLKKGLQNYQLFLEKASCVVGISQKLRPLFG